MAKKTIFLAKYLALCSIIGAPLFIVAVTGIEGWLLSAAAMWAVIGTVPLTIMGRHWSDQF